MKDYTKIFSKAIEISENYDAASTAGKLMSSGCVKWCGDKDDEMCDYRWYVIGWAPCFGHLSREFPAALLYENCPQEIKDILAEDDILFTELEEPMCCDEAVLKRYVHSRKVIDERFLENEDFSHDDERFEAVLMKLEKGRQYYVDSSSFTFAEIEY